MATSRPRPDSSLAANHVWAYNFVFDACANGQTLKCLTVIDEFRRECLAIHGGGGIRSGRVIEVLAQFVSVHGAPRYLRSDNGSEFVAGAILRWLLEAQIETALSDPGRPWQNGADESFNGKCWDEYLSLQWFRNRVEAKVGIEQWRRHYNDLTPMEFRASGLTKPTDVIWALRTNNLVIMKPRPTRSRSLVNWRWHSDARSMFRKRLVEQSTTGNSRQSMKRHTCWRRWRRERKQGS